MFTKFTKFTGQAKGPVVNSEAASGRYIMGSWDGSGIEIDAPAGALSPKALGLLREHRTMIKEALKPYAGTWLRIGELGEHGELQILLDGRIEEPDSTELIPAAGSVQDSQCPAERARSSSNSTSGSWRCPLGHREYWVSDYGLKICCRCHPNMHAETFID